MSPDRRPPGRNSKRRRRAEPDLDFEGIFNEPAPEELSAQERIKRLVSSKLAIAVAVALVLLLIAAVTNRQFNPPGESYGEVTVIIEPGTSTTAITEQLEQAGVVPSALAMRISTRVNNAGPFLAGEYAFAANSSTGEALAVLDNGPKVRTDRILIQEGLRLEEIADIVGRLPGMSRQRFIEVANSGQIRSSLQPEGVTSLEGYLFPDTYFISASDTEEVLVRRMVSTFDLIANETGLANASRIVQRSTFDTLIIASMIEAEAQVAADRAKISQVIQNRLAQEMRLQIDATVLYALGSGLADDRASVSYNQLEVDSPYNTYQNLGLPPGPISNPGEASIRAALQPEPGPWLFYVKTEADGTHSFASTGEEHQRNVEIARQRGFVD